eukprot:scaffold9569_cov142-Isochrysis_galbana.AAC.4
MHACSRESSEPKTPLPSRHPPQRPPLSSVLLPSFFLCHVINIPFFPSSPSGEIAVCSCTSFCRAYPLYCACATERAGLSYCSPGTALLFACVRAAA